MYSFKLNFKDNSNQPKVYLIASPIGNLKEFTPRAVEILQTAVNKIYCEDTRVTVKLLNHYNLSIPLYSLNKDNEKEALDRILDDLKANKNIAIMSDAGYPAISDPGYFIVKNLIYKNCKVIPVNGSSALLSALICSGLDTRRFLFYGFLSKSVQKLKEELRNLSDLPYTIIFYESPNRVLKTLNVMCDVLGDRKVCVAKELTKIYEQFHYGLCSEIIANIEQNTTLTKGEYVIVVEGKQEQFVQNEITAEILTEISELMSNSNVKTKTAISQISKKYNLNKNELYKIYHQMIYKTKNDL